MKHIFLITFIFILLPSLSGCLRDELPPCPPLKVSIGVKDKNYFNIDQVVRQGLTVKKDENLPFKEYVSTLFYSLQDAESGEILIKKSTFTVEGDEKEYNITFPQELPYGKYVLVVWGNIQSDEPLGEDATDAELEKYETWKNDVYMISDTLDYRYQNENFHVELERTKGKLIVQAVDLPSYIDFSTKNINNVYSFINSNFEYSNAIEVKTEIHWEQPNDIVTETLLCPSTGKENSKMAVTFFDYSTVAEETASREVRSLSPEDIYITMGRNEITVVKYVYVREGDPDTGEILAYILINDHWESQHNMEIE